MKPLFLFLNVHFLRVRALGPAGWLAALWLTAPAVVGVTLLYELGAVSRWLHELGGAGLWVHAAAFLVAAGLGLLPTTAQAVLGGWVFGPVRGLFAGSLAYVGAAGLGLLITRAVAGRRVERLVDSRPAARAIRQALVGRGFWRTTGMVALLRLPPQSPFAFTNLVMVSCGAPAGPFLLGTFLGMLPRTALVMGFASAAAGTGAADIQGFVREGPGWPVAVGGLVLMGAVMAVIGAVARGALVRLHVDPAAFR